MSRLDKTTEATLRMLHGTAPDIVPADEVLSISRRPAAQNMPAPDAGARTMVYLPAAWKEKFREIAYHERRKENDLSLEAFRDFLLKKGHKVD
jgi:hypothetical protein